jgi:hypothetical protein
MGPDTAFLAEYRSGSMVLMTKNCKKFTAKKKNKIFGNKKLQFTYPLASIKDVQAKEEAFSPQKRTSIFVGLFCPPGSGSRFRIWIN